MASEAFVPSHFFWADAAKIHLHWLLTQESDKFYERFGVIMLRRQMVLTGPALLQGVQHGKKRWQVCWQNFAVEVVKEAAHGLFRKK